MTNVAQHLKSMMNKRGWTTYALERQAGLKRGAIQNIIYGRSRNPGIEILQPIAQVFECSVSELIGETISTSNSIYKKQDLPKSFDNVEMTPWNPELYSKCFKKVEEIVQKKSIQLSNQKLLNYVHEVYLYSIHKKINTPEEYFVNWLINRFSKEEFL